MNKTIFSLLVAIPLLFAAAAPVQNTPIRPGRTTTLFPNGCAILASQVTSELRRAGCKTEILYIQFLDTKDAHALAVWQPFPNSQVLVFDNTFLHCTINLSLRSMSDPNAVARELNRLQQFSGSIKEGFYLR